MNKLTLKTRILEFLANIVLPAFEDLKAELGVDYSDYKENSWKTIIDIDSPARLLGLPLHLCELDFNHQNKDYSITLTVQILEDLDIGGFFAVCYEHGTICSKDLFFDEITELDSKKLVKSLKTLIESLSKVY